MVLILSALFTKRLLPGLSPPCLIFICLDLNLPGFFFWMDVIILDFVLLLFYFIIKITLTQRTSLLDKVKYRFASKSFFVISLFLLLQFLPNLPCKILMNSAGLLAHTASLKSPSKFSVISIPIIFKTWSPYQNL